MEIEKEIKFAEAKLAIKEEENRMKVVMKLDIKEENRLKVAIKKKAKLAIKEVNRMKEAGMKEENRMKEKAKLAMKEENRNKEEDVITDEIKKKPGFWENRFKEAKKLKRAEEKDSVSVLTREEEEKDSVLTREEEKDSVLTPEQEKESATDYPGIMEIEEVRGFWENWFKEQAKLAKNRAKSHPDYPADINVLTPEEKEIKLGEAKSHPDYPADKLGEAKLVWENWFKFAWFAKKSAEARFAVKEEANKDMKALVMEEEDKKRVMKAIAKAKLAVKEACPPFITDEIKKKYPPGFWENWFKEEAKLAKKKTPEEEKDSVLTPEQEKEIRNKELRNKIPGFESDMEQYNYDMNLSDGFDVGEYPHMFRSVNRSPDWVSCYYNPLINQALPRSRLDTLLCLSNMAISLYNMHQCPPTYYHSVKVLKAMLFGVNSYNNYNLTFQASLPAQLPVTFQTKVKTQTLSRFFEIVFVRKVEGGDDDDQEIDFMGGEKNVSQEIDDEIGTQIYSPYTDSGFKLSLPLSQLALHMFHEKTNSSYDLRYELQTVNVLETKKSVMSAQEGATYLITFEAFWPRMGFEIFQTKIHLSPLVPPVSIRIKSVKILPPF